MADEPLHTTERTQVPPAAPPTNHGRTPAAWVTAAVVMVGTLASAVGLVVDQMWLFWVGVGFIVLGVVLGLVLRVLGFGQPIPSGPQQGSSASGSDVTEEEEQS